MTLKTKSVTEVGRSWRGADRSRLVRQLAGAPSRLAVSILAPPSSQGTTSSASISGLAQRMFRISWTAGQHWRKEGPDSLVAGDDDAVGLKGGFEEVGVFFDGCSGRVRRCCRNQLVSQFFTASQVFRLHHLPLGIHAGNKVFGGVRSMPLPLVQTFLTEDDFVELFDDFENLPALKGRLIQRGLPASGPCNGGIHYNPLAFRHSSSQRRTSSQPRPGSDLSPLPGLHRSLPASLHRRRSDPGQH